MGLPSEEPWIDSQVVTHALGEIEDCAIAVDATYYLRLILNTHPYTEPLLPALGGSTGIQHNIEHDLENWKQHKVTPFFIFDGQPLTGQDEFQAKIGRDMNAKTNGAWDLYFGNRANDAVLAFGNISDAYRPQNFYPILQSVLKARKLHFLVAPYSAAAQIAYLDMIDSDQCAGVMGSLELMLYPIHDSVIRAINWDTKTITAVSRKHIIKALNVSEPLFIDALLMTGTSFLPPFPALLDQSLVKNQPYTIVDAVNMLRASEKSVAQTCNSFNDVLQANDPNWQDKFQKARMAVSHFIYIAENGEPKVHDFDGLTKDNYQYLGFQLAGELYHYLNVGLIGPRVLSWITHGQLWVLPPLAGVEPDEYKKLVSKQLVPIKEAALELVVPRLNRGIYSQPITMKVWYDRNFSHLIWNKEDAKPEFFKSMVNSWNITESGITKHFPNFSHGSIASEVLSLKTPEFASATLWDSKKKISGLDSPGIIKSIAIWRFLHIRGYINDQHELTRWGAGLAAALAALEPTVNKYPEVPHLFEMVVVAFELLRFDILNSKNQREELQGLPMSGTKEDRDNLVLISRCASLLKLRHQPTGYTGPLNKSMLAFRSLVSETRSADRDLVEAILAFMFLYAQSDRKRDDNWQISHDLPFWSDPDVALGIAVKTYLDDANPADSAEQKAYKLNKFPDTFVPYAVAFNEDFDIACNFFSAIHAGVQAMDGGKEIPAADRAIWDRAAGYLAQRI